MCLSVAASGVEFSVEVVTLVVELQHLGILDEKRECATHQLRILANKIVENLPMLFSEVEEQILHPAFRRWAR